MKARGQKEDKNAEKVTFVGVGRLASGSSGVPSSGSMVKERGVGSEVEVMAGEACVVDVWMVSAWASALSSRRRWKLAQVKNECGAKS